MVVEVWSDILCPFCYIGKRKFENALSSFSGKDKIKLVWKSYQLDPSLASHSTEPYSAHLQKTKGWSASQTKEILANVTAMASEVGLQYQWDKAVLSNSFTAHRFSHFAASMGKQDAAEEALFRAHFIEGKDIGNHEVLANIAVLLGLDKAQTLQMLASEAWTKEVQTDISDARKFGVSGVPFFVFDRKYAISGAQDEKVFLSTIEKSFAEWQQENKSAKLEIIEGKTCKPNGECN
ncbi:MAG: DsbA family oxidoreductase [Chitinophagaceae bacterium]|nr:DsbA family oxidoreductase [Chitinophagaceae bacterium]